MERVCIEDMRRRRRAYPGIYRLEAILHNYPRQSRVNGWLRVGRSTFSSAPNCGAMSTSMLWGALSVEDGGARQEAGQTWRDGAVGGTWSSDYAEEELAESTSTRGPTAN